MLAQQNSNWPYSPHHAIWAHTFGGRLPPHQRPGQLPANQVSHLIHTFPWLHPWSLTLRAPSLLVTLSWLIPLAEISYLIRETRTASWTPETRIIPWKSGRSLLSHQNPGQGPQTRKTPYRSETIHIAKTSPLNGWTRGHPCLQKSCPKCRWRPFTQPQPMPVRRNWNQRSKHPFNKVRTRKWHLDLWSFQIHMPKHKWKNINNNIQVNISPSQPTQKTLNIPTQIKHKKTNLKPTLQW